MGMHTARSISDDASKMILALREKFDFSQGFPEANGEEVEFLADSLPCSLGRTCELPGPKG